MKHLTLLVLTLTIGLTTFAQDIIIKKNGDEVTAKILEVALTIVKYKKIDNLNGPTFEILKSEIFMIKYENGTKDIINEIETRQSQPAKAVNKPEKQIEEEEIDLAFTENHKSTSLFYGASFLGGGFTSGSGSGSSYKHFAVGPIILLFNKGLSNKFSIHYGPSVMYIRETAKASSGQ